MLSSTMVQRRCLPGLHAFTGCDFVSAFSGKGKVSVLRMTKRHVRLRELFQFVATDWDASDELFSRLQEFTRFMYSSNPEAKLTCGTVSSLRQDGTLTSTSCRHASTLRKDCESANHQSATDTSWAWVQSRGRQAGG